MTDVIVGTRVPTRPGQIRNRVAGSIRRARWRVPTTGMTNGFNGTVAACRGPGAEPKQSPERPWHATTLQFTVGVFGADVTPTKIPNS